MHRLRDLCTREGLTHVLQYYAKEWEPYKEHFADSHRPRHIRDRTNNIAESHFKVLKYSLLRQRKLFRLDALLDLWLNTYVIVLLSAASDMCGRRRIMPYYRTRHEMVAAETFSFASNRDHVGHILHKAQAIRDDDMRVRDAALGMVAVKSSADDRLYEVDLHVHRIAGHLQPPPRGGTAPRR